MRNVRLAGVIGMALWGAVALAQGASVLTGTVVDAATQAPLADVVVTATSPQLQGEQVVVTDATGLFRIPQLPPGGYALRFEKEGFRPLKRDDIALRLNTTVRVNVPLLPEALQAEEIVVVARAPTVDVGSTSTGTSVGTDFIRNIAVVRPGSKGSASRSFESLAEVAPGARADAYGVSINGTTSPENSFVMDGLSVNDPLYGTLGTPISAEFVQEVNVITGGFMPEFGRSTGGVLNVVTKSGSNEFHGSVFSNFTPGLLSGTPQTVRREGTTLRTQTRLWNQGDAGLELGGPILKDKLWFYVGLSQASSRYQLNRTLNVVRLDGAGLPVRDDEGLTVVDPIENAARSYFADQGTRQYLGKLTYLFNADHSLTLSVYGTPTTSGGNGTFAFDPNSGDVEVGNINGAFETLAHRNSAQSNDVSLKLASSFLSKRVLLDVTLGWHHQDVSSLPSDGSAIGSDQGLAAIPRVNFRRSSRGNYHSLNDFETLPDSSVCESAGSTFAVKCPVINYSIGGPGYIYNEILDRYAGRAVGTGLFSALGHHVVKAGVEVDLTTDRSIEAYTGKVLYREATNGRSFQDYRAYGDILGPDQWVLKAKWDGRSSSLTVGGFVQDSWSILDLVTLNAGVRYDTQTFTGGDNLKALVLPNQWSPRIGIVYDITQQGRSKLYANYARFYQNGMLEMIARQFPGERRIEAFRNRTATADRPGCDPLVQGAPFTQCQDPRNLRSLYDVGFNYAEDPNDKFIVVHGDKSPVDPALQPQSSDEFVLGGEYEVMPFTRAGASYTKRYMNAVVEDMSRDEGTSYFIANPGQGLASDFPRAERNYDAVTVFLNRTFAEGWLAQASYTWSSLRGNYSGLFRPESGQLEPNITSAFDLVSLLKNGTGPLPGDVTHAIKIFAAKQFNLTQNTGLSLGLTYRGNSGTPLNVFGAHYLYGSDQVYILPRGSGGRLPWVSSIDARLSVNVALNRDSVASFSIDGFNVFNFQTATGKDQTYTLDDVSAIENGTTADLASLSVTKNPNYGNVTAYQPPRSIRFGARLSF